MPTPEHCPACGTPLYRSGQRRCGHCGRQLLDLPGASEDGSALAEDEPKKFESADGLLRRLNELTGGPKPGRTLRELWSDLGLALEQSGRFVEAATALQNALKEQGTAPSTGHLLLVLARACLLEGDLDRAVRSTLEAVVELPEETTKLLAVLPLSNELALSLGSWVYGPWRERFCACHPAPAGRAWASVFVARVHLFRSSYSEACDELAAAFAAAPADAVKAADELLDQRRLPAVLAESADASAQFTRAQLHWALRRHSLALAHVSSALELNIQHEAPWEPAAWELKGELLETSGETAKAIDCFCEAASRFNSRRDYAHAVSSLRRATKIGGNHAQIWWQLMDALRMLNQRDNLDESLGAWEHGVALVWPDSTNAWSYVSRAFVNFQVIDWRSMPWASSQHLYWEGACYVERSLLRDPSSTVAWCAAARFYELLDCPYLALAAISHALNLDSTNAEALEERVVLHLICGDLAEAEQSASVLQERAPGRQADYRKAIVLACAERYDEACRLLSERLKAEPFEPTLLEWRAFCHFRSKRVDEARRDWETILDRHRSEDPPSTAVIWAALELSRLDLAIEVLEKMLQCPAERPDVGSLYLGLAHLQKGELKVGRRFLLEGIAAAANLCNLDLFAKGDFADMAREAERTSSEQVRQIFAEARSAIDTRRLELVGRPSSPEAEATQLIASAETGGWARIGARAGLARFYTEGKRWNDAAAIYELLQEENDRFPESSIGLEKAVAGLQTEGESQLRLGEFADSLKQFTSGLNIAVRVGLTETIKADLYCRMGYVHFASQNLPSARASFVQALQIYRQSGNDEPGTALGTACAPLLRYAAEYWALDEDWKCFRREAENEKELPQDLEAAENALAARYLQPLTRVALEIGTDLLRFEEEQSWPLLKHLSTMRKRLQENMGIQIPGFLVSDNQSLPPSTYVIKLDGIPVVEERVELGHAYCVASRGALEALGISPEKLSEVPHPLTGEPGCWLAAECLDVIKHAGFETWEQPDLFLTCRSETILRAHLGDFLGFQDAENLLRNWGKNERGPSLIAASLPDRESKLRFARVLRALVSESVPIKPWEDILATIQNVGLAHSDVTEAVRALRLRLKKSLPGHDVAAGRVELAADIEEGMIPWVWRKDGRTFFAVPRGEAVGVLSRFYTFVDSLQGKSVLTTHRPELRPSIRLLIEYQSPAITVLSAEELEEGFSREESQAAAPSEERSTIEEENENSRQPARR